jgi:hypothetical protein
VDREALTVPRAKPKKSPRTKAKHGGARAGAGRPRDRIPATVLDRLGDVPTDVRVLDTWLRRLLAEILVLQMKGEISVDLAASLRATCGEIRRGMPEAPPPSEGDDDDHDDSEGPELEDVKQPGDVAHGALRVG